MQDENTVHTATARYREPGIAAAYAHVLKDGEIKSTWCGWNEKAEDLPGWFAEMDLEIASGRDATDESGAVIGLDYSLRPKAK